MLFCSPREVPHRTILIGGFTRLGCYGQRDTPEGPFPKTRERHQGIIPEGPRPRRGGEIIKEVPEGQTLGAGQTGEKAPMDVDGGGYLEFGPQLDTIPETDTAPESGRQPPSAGGGALVPPATSVQPEVSDTLSAALKSTSIVEEHCALMGAMIGKIQSAESGLDEACISLITGFEVCFVRFPRVL